MEAPSRGFPSSSTTLPLMTIDGGAGTVVVSRDTPVGFCDNMIVFPWIINVRGWSFSKFKECYQWHVAHMERHRFCMREIPLVVDGYIAGLCLDGREHRS